MLHKKNAHNPTIFIVAMMNSISPKYWTGNKENAKKTVQKIKNQPQIGIASLQNVIMDVMTLYSLAKTHAKTRK